MCSPAFAFLSSMYRALIELALTIVVLIVARAILTTVLKGLANLGSPTAQRSSEERAAAGPPPTGRDLHKDPVCGTYVTDSTPYQRQSSGNVYYYCSEQCRSKHAVAAR